METLQDLSTPVLNVNDNGKLSSTSTNDNHRIPQIDGLRGIAILLVISFHYLNNQLLHAQSSIGKLLCKATSFGWVGVDLFFVLSGFLIGNILIKKKGSKNFFSTFYIRRIVRIIPNYYLAITLFLIVGAIPFFADNKFLAGDKVIPEWSYFVMIHNNFMAALNNMGNNALSITWSIGIEEQFYIIFPFVVYIVKDRWLPVLLVFVIIVASIFRFQFNDWVPTYVLLPCRMDALSFGILVAYYYQKKSLTNIAQKYFKILIGVMILDIVVCAFLYLRYNDLGVLKHSLFAIFFAILLVFALTKNESFYTYLLKNKVLVTIGTLSYSLYLFHYFILGLFHHFAGNKDGLVIANVTDMVVTILALVTSFLISWTVYKLFETPMVNFGKRFNY